MQHKINQMNMLTIICSILEVDIETLLRIKLQNIQNLNGSKAM